MSGQEKHVEQSNSSEEKKAIQGAENAAKNAHPDPEVAPVPAKPAYGLAQPDPDVPSTEVYEHIKKGQIKADEE